MIKKWKEILMVIVGSMMMGASIDLFVQADFGLDRCHCFRRDWDAFCTCLWGPHPRC